MTNLIKYEQYFVNPAHPEPGITSTSASFLAGLASQEVNRLEAQVKASVFYDTFLELLSGSDHPRLIAKGKDEAFLKEVLPVAEKIGGLRGFMAYVHEAVKEKERRTNYLDELDYSDWLELPENSARRAERAAIKDPTRPTEPAKPAEVTKEWAKSQLSVKDLAHYLLLEAKASTLGVYIHPAGERAQASEALDREEDFFIYPEALERANRQAHAKGGRAGVLAHAKDELANRIARPIKAAVDGGDTTIYSYKPSADPGLVYDSYNCWQQAHRAWEAEVNTIKAKLGILMKNESLERTRRYREALNEYDKALKNYQAEVDRVMAEEKKLQTEYADWLVREHEAVRQLKIIVPHEMQAVYDYLASLGK